MQKLACTAWRVTRNLADNPVEGCPYPVWWWVVHDDIIWNYLACRYHEKLTQKWGYRRFTLEDYMVYTIEKKLRGKHGNPAET
jgi:hypothetical protein